MKDYTIYVIEEIAKKAIEKGFPEHLCEYVDETMRNGELIPFGENTFTPDNYFIRRCPTAEQICGWLREEKHLWVTVQTAFWKENNFPWIAKILNLDTGKIIQGDCTQEDYNLALFEGINKALKLI